MYPVVSGTEDMEKNDKLVGGENHSSDGTRHLGLRTCLRTESFAVDRLALVPPGGGASGGVGGTTAVLTPPYVRSASPSSSPPSRKSSEMIDDVPMRNDQFPKYRSLRRRRSKKEKSDAKLCKHFPFPLRESPKRHVNMINVGPFRRCNLQLGLHLIY